MFFTHEAYHTLTLHWLESLKANAKTILAKCSCLCTTFWRQPTLLLSEDVMIPFVALIQFTTFELSSFIFLLLCICFHLALCLYSKKHQWLAMVDEIVALHVNDMCDLMLLPPIKITVDCHCICTFKLVFDGHVDCLKSLPNGQKLAQIYGLESWLWWHILFNC